MNTFMPISAGTGEGTAPSVPKTAGNAGEQTVMATDDPFGIMLAAMSGALPQQAGQVAQQVETGTGTECIKTGAVDAPVCAEGTEAEAGPGLSGQTPVADVQKISGASAFKFFLSPAADPEHADAGRQISSAAEKQTLPDAATAKMMRSFADLSEGRRSADSAGEVGNGLVSSGLTKPSADGQGREMTEKAAAIRGDIRSGQKISQDMGDIITAADTGSRRQEQPVFQTIKLPSKEQVSFEPERGKDSDALSSETSRSRAGDGSSAAAPVAGHTDELADRYQESIIRGGSEKGPEQAGIQMAGSASTISRSSDLKASMPETAASVAARPETALSPQNADTARFLITRHDSRSIEVSLHPEGLGKLDIGLVLDKGILHAQIQASHPAGRELVERNMTELMNALGRDGIMIGGFTVSLKNNNSDWGGNSGGYSSGREDAPTEEITSLSSHIVRDNSLISIFV